MQKSQSFSFAQQPKGLFVLFFAELWERFSFYGMRALLTLYMIKMLMYGDEEAYGIYGAYGVLVYAGPLIGGYLAEKVMGYKNAIVLGGIIMALGHFCMVFRSEFMFFNALALIAIGNGFFKPNISTTVGLLYNEKDPRRDVGFSIFYIGINIGALGQILCGYLGGSENYGWHWGFSIAGIGMVIGLLVFLLNKNTLVHEGNESEPAKSVGNPPNAEMLYKPRLGVISLFHVICIAPFLVIPLYVYLLHYHSILNDILSVIGIGIVIYFLVEAFKREKVERERIFVILILVIFNILFWSFFEQAGSSLSVFTDKNIDKIVMGNEIPAPVFQAINAIFIIIYAPLFSMLWSFLGSKGIQPSIPVKFSLGIFQLGIGFYILSWGAGFANAAALVPLIFLILGYMFHTTGEVCISPVGLSMITKLAPKDLVGVMMGAWMLSFAFAHSFGAQISKLTIPPAHKFTDALSESVGALHVYATVFSNIGLAAMIAGALLLLLSPLLKKWMHGVV